MFGRIVFPVLTHFSLTCCFVLGAWFGVAELLRLAVFGTWLLFGICFFGLFVPGEQLYTDPPLGRWRRVASFFIWGHVAVIVAGGWMATGAAYCIMRLFVRAKRIQWENEQLKTQQQERCEHASR